MLTPKQEIFCIEFVATGNASEAYRRAYNTGNMKPETINRNAKALTDDNKIATRVKGLLEKYEASAAKTIKRLMQGQEFDVRRLYKKNGKLKLPHELDEDTAKCIVGIKWFPDKSVEYKIIDVKGCTELIGRHLAMFTDRSILVDEREDFEGNDPEAYVKDAISQQSQ